MKLMFCQDCGSLVVPGSDMEPKWCDCHRHAVWWRDGRRGLISFFDEYDPSLSSYQSRAYLIGVNNAVLAAKSDLSSAADYRELAAACGPSYLFHAYESNIVRIRPGVSNDSRWENATPGRGAPPPTAA